MSAVAGAARWGAGSATRTAFALSWQLWRRGARTAAVLLVYGSVLALLARSPVAGQWREALLMATIPLAFGILFFLAGFAFPEADMLARHSGFPAWMLVLPAHTWELALWPMLHGACAAALCWLLPVHGIFAPLDVPIAGWPAALIAALLAILQALLWTPVGLAYLRVVLALLLAPLLVTVATTGALNGTTPVALSAGFGGILILAYAAAVAGLTRARRGEAPEWSLRSGAGRWALGAGFPVSLRDDYSRAVGAHPTQSPEPSAQRRLLSPLRAQIWYEWRAGGMALPLLTTVLGGVFSLPFLWVREMTPLWPGAPPGTAGAISVNVWLKIIQPCLYALPLLAALIGCGRRRWEGRGEHALPWFTAIRPLEDTALVAARFGMAGRSTAAAWGVALAVVAGWLLLPAQDGERSGPLLFLLIGHLTTRDALVALIALGFLVLWTWKSQAQGFWADASGRAGIVHGAPILAHGAVLAAFVWLAQHTGPVRPNAPVPVALWIAAGVALVLKALAATVAFRALLRSGQIAPRALAAIVAGWLLTAVALAAALLAVAGPGPRPGSLEELLRFIYLPLLHPIVLPPAFRAPLALLLFALLFVPLARLAAAPLALGWNRRR